jgi:hypothetical protein
MAQHPDYFSDMLDPTEEVRASLGGAGVVADGQRTWIQLALTERRMVVIVLTQGALGGSYHPTQRLVADQRQIQILRFPRTATSSARLEVEGFGQSIVLPDIDHPDLFPQIEPFVRAWGQPLGGAGTIRPVAFDPLDAAPTNHNKMILVTAIVAIGIFAMCCVGSSVIIIIQRFVLPNL